MVALPHQTGNCEGGDQLHQLPVMIAKRLKVGGKDHDAHGLALAAQGFDNTGIGDIVVGDQHRPVGFGGQQVDRANLPVLAQGVAFQVGLDYGLLPQRIGDHHALGVGQNGMGQVADEHRIAGNRVG